MINIYIENLIVIVGIYIVFIPSVAYAYVDPGTGSFIWQSLVAAGLGFTYYIYRLREKIMQIFRGK